MSGYNIPDDLLENVLLRLPIDSLLRSRCVSKSWRALIDCPDFAKMHFRVRTSLHPKSKEDLKIVSLGDQSSFSTLEFDSKECSNASAKQLNHPLHLINPGIHGVHLIGSCNGLLCLTNSNADIVLWNPWTQKHWDLPSPPIQYPYGSHICFRLGFGYEQVNDDYKIVNFLSMSEIFGEAGPGQDEVYVYSLKLNSWRRIGEFAWKFPEHRPDVGAFANGALHWIVKKKQGDVAKANFIVSFDLKNEEFRRMPCPRDPHHEQQHLRILDGKLCLLSYYYFAGLYLWVMKEYGVEKSWTKLTSIEMPHGNWSMWNVLTPITFLKNGQKLLLQIERDKLVVYDLLTKHIEDVRINGSAATSSRASCVCLRSLVQPCGGEGKDPIN